jgi:hypothetical protein
MTKTQYMLPDHKWYLVDEVTAVMVKLGGEYVVSWIQFKDVVNGALIQVPVSSILAIREASDKEFQAAMAAMEMVDKVLGGKK